MPPLVSCTKKPTSNNKSFPNKVVNRMKKSSIAAAIMACMVGMAVAAAPTVDDVRVDAMVKQFTQQFQGMNQGQAIPAEQQAQLKQQIKQHLLQQEVLKQEALKIGLDKKPEVQAMLKNFEAQVYADAYLQQLKDNVTVSEADLQAKYRAKFSEVKLQFAEFASKDEAVKAQQLLLKGANFADLAKTLSNQKESIEGQWWPVEQMGQFPDAVKSLVKGQITAEPVELDGKFYLFRVGEERMGAQAPAFEQVKEQLANEAKEAKVKEQVMGLFKANGLEMPQNPAAAQ